MQLADLQRHLDGSLREETLRELARETGVSVPADLRFRAGMGLEEALDRFRITVAVMQRSEALRRIAAEICEDAQRTNVTTLEVRFAPQLHGDVERAVDAVLEGIAGKAGLILCALFGESPTSVLNLVRVGAARAGVVGIDLAGSPLPRHGWTMRDYADAFQLARDLGLGRTVHAGEGRPPQEIRVAIETLGADRIGHGTTLLDDVSVVDLVLRQNVTIEACLTSNVHTGALSGIAEHPLPHWLKRGIRACVCTDNTLLSSVDSPQEHARAMTIPGMTPELLQQAIINGHAAAFRRRQ